MIETVAVAALSSNSITSAACAASDDDSMLMVQSISKQTGHTLAWNWTALSPQTNNCADRDKETD